MSNFWKTLPDRFLGVSPMDGVTDHPFREIQAKYGKPAVMYTEFTNVEGIAHGATRLLEDFLYSDQQRPIVGQIFGHTPKDFRMVATILCILGFDGVDINMGCPAKTVASQGCGAALIKTPDLAQEIVRAAKAGVQDWMNGMTIDDLDISEEIKREVKKRNSRTPNSPIPVSVKTRIGYDTPVVQDWISTLLETEPAAIALHGRTLKQQYSGFADWDEIAKAVETAKGSGTIIMGNGDVKDHEQAKIRFDETGVNGILLGRATMGNPWIFNNVDASIEERFAVAVEHSEIYEKTFSHKDRYNFMPMRKHLGWYVKEFPGASEVRQRLIRANSAQEVKEILDGVKINN